MNRSSLANTKSSLQATDRSVQLSQFTAPGRACAKFVLHSPPKVRRITRLLKGYLVKDALDMLKFYQHGAALAVYKVVKSAAYNYLQSNPNSTIDMLQIHRVFADDAPRLKRLWRRARGRADVLLKRMCHITVIVDATDSTFLQPKTIAQVTSKPKSPHSEIIQKSIPQTTKASSINGNTGTSRSNTTTINNNTPVPSASTGGDGSLSSNSPHAQTKITEATHEKEIDKK